MPAGGTGVTGVQMALILDVQLQGGEARLERLPQTLFAAGIQVCPGAALVLPLSHSTCGIMNSIMAAVMPKTLKFTQTCSGKLRATQILSAASSRTTQPKGC